MICNLIAYCFFFSKHRDWRLCTKTEGAQWHFAALLNKWPEVSNGFWRGRRSVNAIRETFILWEPMGWETNRWRGRLTEMAHRQPKWRRPNYRMWSPPKKVLFLECVARCKKKSLGLSNFHDKAEPSKFPSSGKRSPFLPSYPQISWVETGVKSNRICR